MFDIVCRGVRDIVKGQFWDHVFLCLRDLQWVISDLDQEQLRKNNNKNRLLMSLGPSMRLIRQTSLQLLEVTEPKIAVLKITGFKLWVGGWGDGSASKCLWHKCEGLSLIPHPRKLCTLSPQCWGCRDRRILGPCWPARQASHWELGSVIDTVKIA